MVLWVLSFLLAINISYSEVGRVLKVLGGEDAYIQRGSEKIPLNLESTFEVNDEVFTQNSVVVIHLYPGTQMSLSKETYIKISQLDIEESTHAEESFSIINFIKGIVRLQITKDANEKVNQQVQAENVSFSVRGTEFEVAEAADGVDLDVFEGEVEVSSPLIQTFVPEIVKPNEGFKFSRKERKFLRRKFGPRFKNHPGFINRRELRAKWKMAKSLRKATREKRKANRANRQTRKKERRANRIIR